MYIYLYIYIYILGLSGGMSPSLFPTVGSPHVLPAFTLGPLAFDLSHSFGGSLQSDYREPDLADPGLNEQDREAALGAFIRSFQALPPLASCLHSRAHPTGPPHVAAAAPGPRATQAGRLHTVAVSTVLADLDRLSRVCTHVSSLFPENHLTAAADRRDATVEDQSNGSNIPRKR